MSATLPARTRDGGFSIAAMLEAATEDHISVTVAEAAAWAKSNKVSTAAPGGLIASINAARIAAGLPVFRIMQEAPPPAPLPVPHIARRNDPQVSHKAAGEAGAAGPADIGSPATTAQVEPTLPTATAETASEALAPPPPTAAAKVDQHQEPIEIQGTTLGAIAGAAIFSSTLAAPRSSLPATEFEFIDLISSYTGTITGPVTADLAAWILTINTANRPLNHKTVGRFVRILQQGQWINTGEAIIISREGILNEGQHRLTAIVKTGIAAEMDIRFGIAREAFAATGTGTRRTNGNVLAISGKHLASAQAAIARLLHHHDVGRMDRASQQIESIDVLSIVEANPAIEAVAAHIRRFKFAPVRSSPFGLALVLASRAAPMERVLAFADAVEAGKTEETCPARLLHLRLRDAAISKVRLSQVEVAALAVLAFNGWVAGKQMRHLRIDDQHRTGDGFPKVIA